MKNIVNHGTTPIHRRICFYCQCDFTFQDADTEYRPSQDECRSTGLKPVKFVTCPECGKVNVLYNPNKPKTTKDEEDEEA